MKTIVFGVLLTGLATSAMAQMVMGPGIGGRSTVGGGYSTNSGTYGSPGDHYVNGYTRNNGTYVAPHYQTNPNRTQTDNYSSYPNVNPYTGQMGTRTPRY